MSPEGQQMPEMLIPSPSKRKWEIVWANVIYLLLVNVGAIYGAYLLLTKIMFVTVLFTFTIHVCSSIGITAGAHRLWAHKSYKARLPLRILLIIFNTIAVQYSVLHWVRDHRMHHKYSDTDADPHNASRGFFFSHIGWLMIKKHPKIKAMSHTIDMSDLQADPVLRFQKRYYWPLAIVACFVFPAYVPTLWGETFWEAFYVCGLLRYCLVLHITSCVNSAAHKWGNKPYDKNIIPVEAKYVSIVALGEGFHNYHHTFPWDYKTAELGNYTFNITTLFIDTMAAFGWAYDLKTVSSDVIEKRIKRTGDGSHILWGSDDKENLQNAIPK